MARNHRQTRPQGLRRKKSPLTCHRRAGAISHVCCARPRQDSNLRHLPPEGSIAFDCFAWSGCHTLFTWNVFAHSLHVGIAQGSLAAASADASLIRALPSKSCPSVGPGPKSKVHSTNLEALGVANVRSSTRGRFETGPSSSCSQSFGSISFGFFSFFASRCWVTLSGSGPRSKTRIAVTDLSRSRSKGSSTSSTSRNVCANLRSD